MRKSELLRPCPSLTSSRGSSTTVIIPPPSSSHAPTPPPPSGIIGIRHLHRHLHRLTVRSHHDHPRVLHGHVHHIRRHEALAHPLLLLHVLHLLHLLTILRVHLHVLGLVGVVLGLAAGERTAHGHRLGRDEAGGRAGGWSPPRNEGLHRGIEGELLGLGVEFEGRLGFLRRRTKRSEATS